MWFTPTGRTTIGGDLFQLMVNSGLSLIDSIRGSRGCKEDFPVTGVKAFDALKPDQKDLAILWIFEQFNSPETPPLACWNEAVIKALFLWVKGEIDYEIDANDDPLTNTYWRELAVNAMNERGCHSPHYVHGKRVGPSYLCPDSKQWYQTIDSLSEELLWDNDFEMDEMLDLSPGIARVLKKRLGIDQDYFTMVPPIFDKKNLREREKRLRRFERSCWKQRLSEKKALTLNISKQK